MRSSDLSPWIHKVITVLLTCGTLLLQPSEAIASPAGGPGNSSRIVFGKANPTIAFCDPSRASASSHGDSFRGVSIEGRCGDINLIFSGIILGQRVSRAAFNFSGSPGTTLTGVNWMMSEAVVYDDTTGQLGVGGKWYAPQERGLAGFEFEAKLAGRGLEVLVKSPGSASNLLMRFGEPNPLGYRAVTEILGAHGSLVAYGGTPQNPEITYTDGKGFKTKVLYKTAQTKGATQVIDKIVVTPSGSSLLLATFELTNMAGTNYVTRYQDAAQGLSFAFEYLQGMDTFSLPEAFATHSASDRLNGQVLRAVRKVSSSEPSPSGRSIPVPRLNMQFRSDSETPTLLAGSREKFRAISEVQLGALQFSNGTSLLEDHVKADGSAPEEKSLSGFSNWSYKELHTREYPQNIAQIPHSFEAQETIAGTTLRYERNSVGAVTRLFRKLREGREFEQASIERDGYWVKSVSHYSGTRTVKSGDPIYPQSITTTDPLGRFTKYEFTYKTFQDPRASLLTQSLLSRVTFSNSVGIKWSQEFFWDADKLVGAKTANGIRIDRSDAALAIKSHNGSLLAEYEIVDSPLKTLVAQRDIFRLQQDSAGATTSTRAEFAGGVVMSSRVTLSESSRPGLFSLNATTGESSNAEGDRNQTASFSNIGGMTVKSQGEQGSFTAIVNTGLQQSVPNLSCSANGIPTTTKSCTRDVGIQPSKETTYGGGGLGIEQILCLPNEENPDRIKIGVKYTNALASIIARATLKSLGGETRTILEDGRKELTNIDTAGTILCEDDFTPTGDGESSGGESRLIECLLPSEWSGGDELVLFAGIMGACNAVLDTFGNTSHCGAPVLAPGPSFTGIYSNWVSVPDCSSGGVDPLPTPVDTERPDDPTPDPSDGGLSR